MSDNRVALVTSHRFGGHTAEIVIGGVIFTDMIETKAKIFAFPQPSHGRTEFARRGTARVVAARDTRCALLAWVWF